MWSFWRFRLDDLLDLCSNGRSVAFRIIVGSLGVAFISDLFSKRLRMPVTIFNIPGMVPLVPGGLAYQAVRNLVTESYQSSSLCGQAIMIAGAIAGSRIIGSLLTITSATSK